MFKSFFTTSKRFIAFRWHFMLQKILSRSAATSDMTSWSIKHFVDGQIFLIYFFKFDQNCFD